MAGRWAYSNGSEYVCIYFEGLLVDARGQDGVEALGEAQGDRLAVGEYRYVGWVSLQSLEHTNM